MSDSPPPPPAPPSEPNPPPVSVSPAATEGTGLPSNVAAGLACLLFLVGGVIFLVLEKKDQFVRFYAMQSLVLGILSLAVSVALQIAVFILHLIPFLGGLIIFLLNLVAMVVGLAFFVAWIVTMVKAFSGKEWEIPYLGKIAREQLAKLKPAAP